MRCFSCQREIDESLFADSPITDGDKYLCADCARIESNRIFNNLIAVFEANDEIYRKAFAVFGIDDFAFSVDEEMR